jgi:hypothetical protein
MQYFYQVEKTDRRKNPEEATQSITLIFHTYSQPTSEKRKRQIEIQKYSAMDKNNNNQVKDQQKTITKKKLRSIMEAASALTSLGDEDSECGDRSNSPFDGHKDDTEQGSKPVKSDHETQEDEKGSASKRFLPDHKKPDAAPTFPEKVRK